MSEREEIEEQIQQAADQLKEAVAGFTAAAEQTSGASDHAAGEGYDRIADAYSNAHAKLQEALGHAKASDVDAQAAVGLVRETHGLMPSRAGSPALPNPVRAVFSRPVVGRTFRRPNRRHEFYRVKLQNVKDLNTVILPTTDVSADVLAIQHGLASWDGARSEFRIRGRRYGMEENGTLIPKEGPGLVLMSRNQYKAFVGVVTAEGDPALRPRKLVRNHAITSDDWAVAQQTYRLHSGRLAGDAS